MTESERKEYEQEIERLRSQQADRYEEKHKDGAYETSDRIAELERTVNGKTDTERV